MQSFRKTPRRPVRQVSRKRAAPIRERLLREAPAPDLSSLILYGQL